MPLFQGQQPQGFSYALTFTSERLELRPLEGKSHGPISSDLCDRDVQRRINGGRRQPLARASGLHREGPLRVLDATAGLGRDAAVLAGLGCEVTMLERSPVVAALLLDGLERARADVTFGTWVKQRMGFQPGDAMSFMQTFATSAHDVVYLDPMYPQRDKTALAKKEMRVLRELAGDDADADQLLQVALGYARRRVVVKRPPRAGCLAVRAPDHQWTGNRARYDVYFTRAGIRSGAVKPV